MPTDYETNAPSTGRDTLISKNENKTMFDRIARRYDLMNRLISLGLDTAWRKRTVQALDPKEKGRYLDIGAGTGDLCLALSALAPAAQIIGLDPAAGMLALGRRKLERGGGGERIRFITGDAMALPFGDQIFDGIVLGFCIRNVEDRSSALKEMHRTLRPGGRLAILELTIPEKWIPAAVHKLHTRTVVPAAARLLSLTSAYDYLVKSVAAFPSPSAFEKQVRDAGFRDTSVIPLTLGTVSIFCGTKP